MGDLMRYPSVSKFHFLECSGNGLTDWTEGRLDHRAADARPALGRAVDRASRCRGCSTRRACSRARSGCCSKARTAPPTRARSRSTRCWTTRCWSTARTASGCGPSRATRCACSSPAGRATYRSSGSGASRCRDQPWHLRSETARYTDPMPDGKWRQFSFVMECKSVITRPSGGMKLTGPGHATRSRASPGPATAASRRSTSRVDGGKNWREAALEEPVLDKCLTRFRYRLELGRRAGHDREPRRRLAPATCSRRWPTSQKARAHRRLRAASQRHLPVVGQRKPGR